MKFSEFVTNKEKENRGVEVNVGEGFFMTIARLGNEKSKKFMEAANRPHLRRIRKGTLPNELRDEIAIQCISKTVCLGWRGLDDEVLDEDGNKVINEETGEVELKDVPYSEAEAINRMTISDDFLELVVDYASDMQIFKDEDDKDAEGNSLPTSSGN